MVKMMMVIKIIWRGSRKDDDDDRKEEEKEEEEEEEEKNKINERIKEFTNESMMLVWTSE